MTDVEPDLNLTGRYPISVAAMMLGISPTTLRRYTQEGKIKCGWRQSNGRRYYTGMELMKLWKRSL